MKIIENTECAEDFAGRYPVCAVKGAELAKIAGWLFSNHSDFVFGIVISTIGEYPVPENVAKYTVDVFFLDDLFTEIVAYISYDEARQRLDEMRDKNLSREEALTDIIQTSAKTRKSTNKALGLEEE